MSPRPAGLLAEYNDETSIVFARRQEHRLAPLTEADETWLEETIEPRVPPGALRYRYRTQGNAYRAGGEYAGVLVGVLCPKVAGTYLEAGPDDWEPNTKLSTARGGVIGSGKDAGARRGRGVGGEGQ